MNSSEVINSLSVEESRRLAEALASPAKGAVSTETYGQKWPVQTENGLMLDEVTELTSDHKTLSSEAIDRVVGAVPMEVGVADVQKQKEQEAKAVEHILHVGALLKDYRSKASGEMTEADVDLTGWVSKNG